MKSQLIPIVSTAVLLALLVPPVEASPLRRAVAKATAAKQASKTIAASKVAAERAAMEKVLRSLDQRTIRKIEANYGAYIPKERLARAQQTPTGFLDARAYDEHLQKAYPGLAAAERRQIVGDYIGRPYVRKDTLDLPSTVAHERIHQLSAGSLERAGAHRFNEGMTEHFTRTVHRDLHIKGYPTSYTPEREIVSMMAARVGDRSLARAYFSGDLRSLRQAVDAQLGAGSFSRIVVHVERGQFQSAKTILGGK